MIQRLRALSERTPLRVRLVAAVLVLVALALASMGAAGTLALRGYLLDRVDAQLREAAAGTIGLVMREGPGVVQESSGLRLAPSPAFYVQYTDPAGHGTGLLRRPAGSGQQPPKLPALDAARLAAVPSEPFTTAAQDGRGHSWRVLVAPLPDGLGSVTVALSLEQVEDTVTRLVWLQSAIGALVLLALAVLGYAMVRTSLRRLVEVERTAAAIAAGDLTRRVPASHPGTEVGRLSAALNTMLAEIESAFRARESAAAAARASEARMRRFVADASHELRTPLTAIRGFAELYRHSRADPAHIIGRIEHHAVRMGLLVDDLLLLARLDQQRPLVRGPVDLLALAADAVADTAATAADHRVRLHAVADRPAMVLGDEARLRQVIGNLLANAVTHTPAGTQVTVTVDTDGDRAVLEVADTGPGLSEEDVSRVFERFFRTDPARTRAHGGAGLGLSIVEALVAAHGGEVAVHSAPGAGSVFTVRLPLLPAAQPDAARELTAPPGINL